MNGKGGWKGGREMLQRSSIPVILLKKGIVIFMPMVAIVWKMISYSKKILEWI